MRRRSAVEAEAPGQDSFLDVVCNLVGIMVVLVMVVAAHAKSAIIADESAKTPAEKSPQIDVAAQEATSRNIELGITDLQQMIGRQQAEIVYRNLERDQIQKLVLLAEQQLAERRGKMSDEEKIRIDVSQQILGSQTELSKLQLALDANVKLPPTAIPHLPTPMAKTVFGKEVHFRLSGGRLAYVPFDEMFERLQAEAPSKVHRLKNSPRIEETLPIVQGFGGRYILRLADLNMETKFGTAHQMVPQLERIWLVDAEKNLGEPFEEAMRPGSQFRARLVGLDRQRTVITVWVYPDSFDHFRRLKEELFKAGFLTAARPLPMGFPIGGAPDGSRSAAE